MGKSLRYGEFKFDKGFGFSDSASPEGRKLVQFYATGGKVKAATPKAAKAPAAPPVGALAQAAAPKAPAMKAPRRAPGMPNLMARAARPGGMAKGGKAHADEAMDKKAIKASVHKHERAMHPGKPLTKLARGGVPAFSGKPKIGGRGC